MSTPIAESALLLGRSLTVADSVTTLGPAGTSSEAAALELWNRFGPAEAAGPARVALFDSYERGHDALRSGEHTMAVVANAYAGVSEFYMDPDLYLWGAFVADTPDYGIAAGGPVLPPGRLRLVTHPAPAPLVRQLLPDSVDRLDIAFSTSTSSAAREVRDGLADLALTTRPAAALHHLHFVSGTRTIRMLWSVFRSCRADEDAV